MSDRAIALSFVVGLWWLSTAVVLKLVWLAPSTHRRSLLGSSVLALLAVAGLAWSARIDTPLGAYVGFSCALAMWGWHELTFLLGVLTGPRKTACPPGVRGWARFRVATESVIHHELALAATVVLVVALSIGRSNWVGAGTFMALWVMRLSAKFNVFLGVRNLSEQFVPPHLRYLSTYFRTARLNPLMPLSIVLGAAATSRLVSHSVSPMASTFELIGYTLVAALVGLAVVEHIFLTLPLPDAALWSWAIASDLGRATAVAKDAPRHLASRRAGEPASHRILPRHRHDEARFTMDARALAPVLGASEVRESSKEAQ
jgi:putative photosynthetic complex assembly protein 2